MALGDFHLFSWKSKATQKKEQEEFEIWAFPHGKKQRDNLEALMREVRPKEQVAFILMGYLTCKELYERYLKRAESAEVAIEYMINSEKFYKNIIKKNEMSTYMALVLADAEIDENCIYPSADEIREKIRELEKLRKEPLKKGIPWI